MGRKAAESGYIVKGSHLKMTLMFAAALASGVPPTEVFPFRYETRSSTQAERDKHLKAYFAEPGRMPAPTEKDNSVGTVVVSRQGDSVWLHFIDGLYGPNFIALYNPRFQVASVRDGIAIGSPTTNFAQVLAAMCADDPTIISYPDEAVVSASSDFRISSIEMFSGGGSEVGHARRTDDGGIFMVDMARAYELTPLPLSEAYTLPQLPAGHRRLGQFPAPGQSYKK